MPAISLAHVNNQLNGLNNDALRLFGFTFATPIQSFLVLLPSALSPRSFSLPLDFYPGIGSAQSRNALTLLHARPANEIHVQLGFEPGVAMTNGEERPLYLHISALSPDEYQLYTDVLTELAGPGQDDSQGVHADRPVDVMEARGWIRGRYGLDAGMVDKVRVSSLIDVHNVWRMARLYTIFYRLRWSD